MDQESYEESELRRRYQEMRRMEVIESKFLEVIDDSTWIPVIAFKVLPQNRFETDLMMRSGYGYSAPDYIFLMKVYGENPEVNHDVYGWPRGTRTMPLEIGRAHV